MCRERRASPWAVLLLLGASIGVDRAALAKDDSREQQHSFCTYEQLADIDLATCLNEPSLNRKERLAVLEQAKKYLASGGDQATETERQLLRAVFQDDQAVHRALLDMLVSKGSLDAASAEKIPTATKLSQIASRLLSGRRKEEAWLAHLSGSDCELRPSTSGKLSVSCDISGPCGGACIHYDGHVGLAFDGKAWKLNDASIRGTDDGACGCCELSQ
jgi:hypothetical protein